MDCTLKIIAGPDKDQAFACCAPETYLGRSQRCAIRLSSPAISFEHALITRKGDEFFVENLSANGTLLNHERLPGAGAKTRLRAKDQLQLGPDTVLRVESLPTAASAGSSRRWLLITFVLLLVGLLVVVIADPFSGTTTSDWSKAYQPLQQFAQQEADRHLLPPEFPLMFREAWRLQISGDRTHAALAWKRLSVLLDHADEKQSHPDAPPPAAPSAQLLQSLKDGHSPDLTQEGRPALKYFITLMSHR